MLRKRARLLRNLVTLPLVVIALVLAVEVIGAIFGNYSARALVGRLPVLFYLAAIWMVRSALASIARGELFNQIVPKLLERVGIALAAGALANVFLVTWIWSLLSGRLTYAWYDPAAITLGVVGFALILVARLLAQAGEMRAELDEMF
ncbi:MAG: DUF2975 domain-containing protein [Sphingomonas sp.]